jgi:hypothetical protein
MAIPVHINLLVKVIFFLGFSTCGINGERVFTIVLNMPSFCIELL